MGFGDINNGWWWIECTLKWSTVTKYCLCSNSNISTCSNSNISCETNCQGGVGVECESIGSVTACFPYWAQVGHVWQYLSMSLDMFGQNIASLAKRKQYSAPLWEVWILLSMLGCREAGTMTRVDFTRIPSATLSSSRKCQNV